MFLAQPVFAQSNEKYTGSNVDVRTILSFKASDAAVQKMLPEGWEVNSPAAGPSKGANLGLSLIDQVTVQDAEGKPATSFRGAGTAKDLHLVERFTRVGPERVDYQFTIDDPATFAKPFTALVPMVRADGDLYEYACHEGNYGLANILSGARQDERAATAKK